MNRSLASAIYVGRVAHVRHVPRRHAFAYRLYMLYLDLDELPTLGLGRLLTRERWGLHSFYRRDYRGDAALDLKQTVLDDVERELGKRPQGPVRLLTHVRSLGYVFNPVSFYYCFAADGKTLEAVVAEITNTPWNERHAYVLDARHQLATDAFPKAFHVSPFFPMEQRYHWRLTAPNETLRVAMRNTEDGSEVFRAQLTLRRRELSRKALWRATLSMPLISLKLHAAIYWQALRLWIKRTPVFDHPRIATSCPMHRGRARFGLTADPVSPEVASIEEQQR
ncbi:MAG: DUF1365 domain-containing protein [Deltaproteobacteria bacterium]|nr:DUF1365 domain-containing protein [Deltaproteobacteria bacterium]